MNIRMYILLFLFLSILTTSTLLPILSFALSNSPSSNNIFIGKDVTENDKHFYNIYYYLMIYDRCFRESPMDVFNKFPEVYKNFSALVKNIGGKNETIYSTYAQNAVDLERMQDRNFAQKI